MCRRSALRIAVQRRAAVVSAGHPAKAGAGVGVWMSMRMGGSATATATAGWTRHGGVAPTAGPRGKALKRRGAGAAARGAAGGVERAQGVAVAAAGAALRRERGQSRGAGRRQARRHLRGPAHAAHEPPLTPAGASAGGVAVNRVVVVVGGEEGGSQRIGVSMTCFRTSKSAGGRSHRPGTWHCTAGAWPRPLGSTRAELTQRKQSK